MEYRAHLVEGVGLLAPGRLRPVERTVLAGRLAEDQALGTTVDVTETGDKPSGDRNGALHLAHIDRTGLAATGHVEHEGLAAVGGVEGERDHWLEFLPGDDRHPVADLHLIGDRLVVHQHPDPAPLFAGMDRVAVTLRKHHLGAFFAVAVEGIEAPRLGGADIEEDDVVEHDPLDRDRLAGIHVNDVDRHPGDESLDVRNLRGGTARGLGATEGHLVGTDLDRADLLGDDLGLGAGRSGECHQ